MTSSSADLYVVSEYGSVDTRARADFHVVPKNRVSNSRRRSDRCIRSGDESLPFFLQQLDTDVEISFQRRELTPLSRSDMRRNDLAVGNRLWINVDDRV